MAPYTHQYVVIVSDGFGICHCIPESTLPNANAAQEYALSLGWYAEVRRVEHPGFELHPIRFHPTKSLGGCPS